MSTICVPRRVILIPLALFSFVTSLSPPLSGQMDARRFSAMHWRLIGPFRAGRVTAVAGVPGDLDTYYFGTPGGGVWKTTDGAQVWQPIFDSERVASIGALTVAPSASNVLYVGTGEQTRGRGMYRSSDAGKSWKNIGLQNVPFVQAIVVDPENPDVVVVGGNSVGIGLLWRPYPKSALTDDRGIFKTEDGGKTWKKVFWKDDTLGVVDMCSDPDDPRTLYAVLYHPSTGAGDSETKASSEIVKSTDEGSSWVPLGSKGLPEKDRGRLGIAVATGTGGRRLYVIADQGFFRSDDGGANWQKSTEDPRVIGSPYFSRVFVDTKNPDIVYVAQTSLYRSTNGGRSFEAYVGAPSGDDFHVLWIDPRDSQRMILGVDQGAIVSADGGKTWSSWYNQPTGQFYHVSADNVFPYRVYAAQQDSGTAAVLSRSDYGQILQQDWYSIGGFEYAFIAPDPANPNLVYSNGWYGSVVRFDKNTGEIATVFERGKKYRAAQMPPVVFSPHDPSMLYLGMQCVLKTSNGGVAWQEISSDLTGYGDRPPEEKPDPDKPRPPAITSLVLSPLDAREIWAGTSNRLVQLTRDGSTTWQDVTPPGLDERTQVLYVEASHHAAGTAYLTVGGTRFFTPSYVARTHDYGRTWQKIVTGIPDFEMVRVVREDPKRKGLLYAGTDAGVYVSWDDGDNWQSLSLNLPPTPITDLQVHGNDLEISTFGRALWILDDVTSLREFSPEIAATDVYLFTPAAGLRTRWANYQDTPYPLETPAGQNPPDGAILDYFLRSVPQDDLTLTIRDESGANLATYSSRAKPVDLPPPNVPDYWFAPPAALPKAVGVNRFVWDIRYPAPSSLPYGYFGELLGYTEYTLADHAVPGLTPRQQPRGPLVVPGKYTVELHAGGQTLRQTLTIELDPRVHASQTDLVAQRDLAIKISKGMESSYDAYQQVASVRKELAERLKSLETPGLKMAKDTAASLDKKLETVENGTKANPGLGPTNRDLARLIFSVESADAAPANTVRSAVQESCEALARSLGTWQKINTGDLQQLNSILSAKHKSPLPIAAVETSACGK